MQFAVLDTFSKWVSHTRVSNAIIESPWIWPASETLHFIGLAMLLGTVALLDLRMLGFARSLDLRGLHRLTRWGIAGFVINTVTGGIFFVAAPFQYIHNVVFQLKLLAMLLAGINALVFEFRILPNMEDIGPGGDAPAAAKFTAAFSLVLWLCVMFFGRMLPFLGESF